MRQRPPAAPSSKPMPAKPSFWPSPTSKAEKALLQQLANAVRQDDPEAVAQAVADGAPVDALQLGVQRSFLGAALKAGRFRAVEALLEAGASPLFPDDWRAANPTDPLAAPGTITEQASSAVATAIQEAHWPWVERFFKNDSLAWASLGDALFNNFSTAAYKGVPDATLDIMIHRAQVSRMGVPAASALVESALANGSPSLVERLARRCLRKTPKPAALKALEVIIDGYLSNQTVELASGNGLRIPRGGAIAAAIAVWLEHGGTTDRLKEWTAKAAGLGMDKALSGVLLPHLDSLASEPLPQSWVAGGVKNLHYAQEVWKTFDRLLGERAVNQALLALASSDSFDDLFFERVAKSPLANDPSLIHTVKRLGKAGVEVSPDLVSLVFRWRNPFGASPPMVFTSSFSVSFLEELRGLGWDPTTKAPSGQDWEDLMGHPATGQARAWLRTQKLESSLDVPQQERRGPRL